MGNEQNRNSSRKVIVCVAVWLALNNQQTEFVAFLALCFT